MKILLIGPSIEERGGIVSVILGLQDFLIKNGIHTKILATTHKRGRWRGVFVFIFAWLAIISTCLFRRADVVHLHMSSNGSCLRKILLALTCWAFRLPFVIHLHSGRFSTFHKEQLGHFGRSVVNFTFRRATRVIALSAIWKKWLENTIKLNNVTVVFNGVPNFLPLPSEKRAPTVLFLGRLGTPKGTDNLISAMREIIKTVPDAVLELGGDGDIEIFRQQAFDLKNVHFLGWVDDAGRRAALSRAAVFCLPSWSEGLPMSILEAMSAGLPVVSTPVGGIPETVQEGVTGILVEPGDTMGLSAAISKLLLDTELSNRMGKQGQYRHRDMFSTESMGQGCLEVYISCLKS